MKKVVWSLGLLALASPSAATAAVQDSGRINRLYVYGEEVAISLDSGFPNAIAAKVCPGALGYFAGSKTPSRTLVAALMTAKSAGSRVTVSYGGCEGAWFKISDIFVED